MTFVVNVVLAVSTMYLVDAFPPQRGWAISLALVAANLLGYFQASRHALKRMERLKS